MGLLESVKSGRESAPPRLLIYGLEGVGKSTVASNAPNVIFIQTEDGLGEIDCHKFPLAASFNDVVDQLTALRDEQHDYQTAAIDSLDWLERLIFDAVCKQYGANSIEKVDGGYGRGYVHSLTCWRQVLDLLVTLHRDRGMAILLIAHAKVERFQDPESTAYDRYSPRLHKHASAMLTEWVDGVLFATRRFRVETETSGFNQERGVAHPIGKDGGERILRTVGGPACIAKNRYRLDAEIPLDWSALVSGITNSSVTQDEETAYVR